SDLSSGESWEGPSPGRELPVGSARGSWLAWVSKSDQGDDPTDSGVLTVYDVARREVRHRLPLDPAYISLRFSPYHDCILATITKVVKGKVSLAQTLFWHLPPVVPFGWAQRHQMHARYSFSRDGRWFASATSAHSSACAFDGIAPGRVLLTDLGDSLLKSGA